MKGAVRLSAERLVCWYGSLQEETEEDSAPRHPALARIFGNVRRQGEVFRYRFGAAKFTERGKRDSFRWAGTQIDSTTGTSADDMLRIIEHLQSGAEFKVEIAATGSLLADDIHLLTAAILLTTSVGGKRTSGLGQVQCKDLQLDGAPVDAGQLAENMLKVLGAAPCTE